MNRDPAHPAAAARPPSRSRRRLLAACTGVALLAGCAADAAAQARLVRLDVVDRATGRALPVFHARGETFVAGRPGARYALRLDNRSGERLLVVVAIDGVNIVTGETASVDQDGYVLEPWAVATLTGWRKSLGEVAAFEFTRLPEAYAARTGRPDDVGAIGVAVFRERRAPPPEAIRPDLSGQPSAGSPPRGAAGAPPPPAGAASPDADAAWGADPSPDADAARPADPSPDADAARPAAASPGAAAARGTAAAPGAGAVAKGLAAAAPTAASRDDAGPALRRAPAEPAERLGTGHGGREASWVERTSFERLTARPSELLRLRYDSLPNLVAAGVAPTPARPLASVRPFPADPAPGFVPDPPWR